MRGPNPKCRSSYRPRRRRASSSLTTTMFPRRPRCRPTTPRWTRYRRPPRPSRQRRASRPSRDQTGSPARRARTAVHATASAHAETGAGDRVHDRRVDSRAAKPRVARFESRQLQLAQCRRQGAIRHGAPLHGTGRRGDASAEIWCSQASWPTSPPRWPLSSCANPTHEIATPIGLHRWCCSRPAGQCRNCKSETKTNIIEWPVIHDI